MGTRRAPVRPRTRSVAAAATVLALVAAGAVHATVDRSGAHNAPSAIAAQAPAVPAVTGAPATIPDSAYPYPSNAIFVASNGNNAGAGTVGDPFATVGHAIAVATSGATIVLRAGVYREALGTVNKRVTLQPYPHEQAWLSGSVVVSGWTQVGNAWAHPGWTVQFCQTCFDPAAILAAYPNAGLPDMAFINGRPLSQVTSLAAVGPGKFFVDYGAQTLYVGDDPTGSGTVIESAAQSQAVLLGSGAAGSVVRGIGFEEYASTWGTSTFPAMVRIGAGGADFERDAFVRSASRGLSVSAKNVTITDSLFLDNGFAGIHGNAADYLDVERNVIARNNSEHFVFANSPVAAAAGIKLTHTSYPVVRNNVVQDNHSNGIWFDLSCYAMTMVDNLARRNDWNGLFVEISGTALVASNVSVLNGSNGVKLSGATDTRVYNNTLADNAASPVGVFDDGRRNTDPTTLALGITWQPARNTLFNNILSVPAGGSNGPILLTQDNDRPVVDDAATIITGLDSNVYARPSASSPATLATWIHPAPTAADQFADLSHLHAATGDEVSGIELTGSGAPPLFRNAGSADYTLDPASPAVASGAPLPSDVAAAIGATAGVPVDSGALLSPSSSAVDTNTTVNAPAVELPNPATIGVAVSAASGTALAPSGTVTLRDTTNGATIGTASLDGSGHASFTTNAFTAGSHDLVATYGGDQDDRPSSGTASIDVRAATTTTTVTTDIAQAAFGQPVALDAHVDAAAVPTGTVTFSDSGQSLGTAAVDGQGDATLSVDTLDVGTHAIHAAYSGDTVTAPSDDTSDAAVTVDRAGAQPSLTAAPSVPHAGDPVTLSTLVGAVAPGGGVPTGTASFYDGATKLADAPLDSSGAASVVVGPLAIGSHSLTVSYTGDTHFDAGASDAVTLQVVNDGTVTTLASSTANPVVGQTVTFTAQVTDGPATVTNGSVTFTDTTTSQVLGVAALDTSGSARVDVATLALGGHTVAADYGGDATHDGSSATPLTVTVGPAGVVVSATVTPASVTVGGSVHIHATVAAATPGSGTPAGAVRVDDAVTGARLADLTLDATGAVDTDVPAGPTGAHTLTITYAGSTSYTSGSTGAGYAVVPAASATTVSVDNAHPAFGQTVTLRAVVTGGSSTATGSVQFSDDGNGLGSAPLDATGHASMPVSSFAAGAHSIVASYAGDADHTASDSSASPAAVTVATAATQTALTADVSAPAHGQIVTFTATVTGASPRGAVTLLDGTSPISSAQPLDANGSVTVALASLAVGTHRVTAAYGGDANHAASDTSTAPLTIVVARATTATSLVASTASATVGAPVTLSASVAVLAPGQGVPSGTVTFADGGVGLAPPVALDASGQAALTVSTLPAGAHGLTAAYSGDTSSAASTSPSVSVTVQRRTPTVAITSSQPSSVSGQPVTFTASVTDSAGAVGAGSVVFTDVVGTSTTTLAAVAVDAHGKASYTTSSLGAGAHSVRARYLGGTNDNSAGPAAVAQTVARAASATTLAAMPATSSIGTPLTLTASVAVQAPGAGSPTGTVTFLDSGVAIAAPVALGTGAQASLVVSSLSAGTHHISAAYSGDASIAPSASAVQSSNVALRPTSITATSSAPASVYGQPVTLTVTVTDANGPVTAGSVVFRDTMGGTTVTLATAALTTSGRAQITVAFKRVGAHSIVARYLGNATDAASAPAPIVQNVGRASVNVVARVSPLVIAPGAAATLTVTATTAAPGTGTPSGAFAIFDGAAQIGTGTLDPTTGAQTVSFHPLAGTGTHNITVAFAGTTAFAPATSPAVVVTVAVLSATQTVLSVAPSAPVSGSPVTLSVVVSVAIGAKNIGSRTGTVTFTVDGVAIAPVALSTNAAKVVLNPPARGTTRGTHTVTAAYSGDTHYRASTSVAKTYTVS